MTFIVAIDGPAAAGKGTIARAVAKEFGLRYLDTGLLYRAVAEKVLEGQDALTAARALTPAALDAPGLRRAAVAAKASEIAVLPELRAILVAFQRDFAHAPGQGAVLDGRDIGTVICPEADVKLFVTATPEVRARRRFAELHESGARQTYAEVLAEVEARDRRDRTRATAPLRPAEDALLLDTSNLSIDAAVAKAVTNIKRIMQGRA